MRVRKQGQATLLYMVFVTYTFELFSFGFLTWFSLQSAILHHPPVLPQCLCVLLIYTSHNRLSDFYKLRFRPNRFA